MTQQSDSTGSETRTSNPSILSLTEPLSDLFQSKLTEMCTTRGVRRLICIRRQNESVESELDVQTELRSDYSAVRLAQQIIRFNKDFVF